jgi:hypothetical protein
MCEALHKKEKQERRVKRKKKNKRKPTATAHKYVLYYLKVNSKYK